jgi:glutathione S-transferase
MILEEDLVYSETEEQKETDILFNIILPNLEASLEGGKPYLTGYDFSIADIAYFNELHNVLAILEKDIDAKKFPNADKWMRRINDIGPIRVSIIKFNEELKRL